MVTASMLWTPGWASVSGVVVVLVDAGWSSWLRSLLEVMLISMGESVGGAMGREEVVQDGRGERVRMAE